MVQGRLDEALAVIHRLYTNSHLPVGVRNSTAEVEQELLQVRSVEGIGFRVMVEGIGFRVSTRLWP